MPSYLVPAYIKPYSKIVSWTVPMVFVEEEDTEYISDLPYVTPVIRDTVLAFRDYMKVVMSKDLRGIAEKFKITVEVKSSFYVPLEDFLSRITKDKEYGKLNVKTNLLSVEANKFIEGVYNLLDEDLRSTISIPTQWLVYSRKERLLTRLCWVIQLEGELLVRPYGARGLMLEVDSLKLDKVNTPSLKVLKRTTLLRQRLNDFWRRLLATQLAVEEAQELLGVEAEGTEETREEEIGHVE